MKYEPNSSIVSTYGVFVEQGHPLLCKHVLIDGVRVNDPWGRFNFWGQGYKADQTIGAASPLVSFCAAMKPLQEWCHQHGMKLESVQIDVPI